MTTIRKVVRNTANPPVPAPATNDVPLSVLHYYLNTYVVTEKDMNRPTTNTRIKDAAFNIKGGSYHIPDDEYMTFLKKYYDEIIVKNVPEYLTEIQLPTNGPILVDLDLRFPYECAERKYTRDHISDIIDLYLSELNKMYQFDEDTLFQLYLLEKNDINRIQSKQITKDGIHIIIGINCERSAQILLRKNVMARIQECCEDLGIGGSLGQTNSWDDVFDDSITSGKTGWQLYGSSKPNCASYKLTYVYTVRYDSEEDELTSTGFAVKGNQNVIREHFMKMSARYRDHPVYLYKSEFSSAVTNLNDELQQHQNTHGQRMISTNDVYERNIDILSIRNREELDMLMKHFLDNISSTDYILLRETYEYVMILPSSFYEAGSYSKWMGVGWALRNTDDRLFIVWVAFSAQSASFDYSSIPDLYDRWQRFDLKNPDGLTKRSILYWAKEFARAKYNEVRLNSVDYKIEQSLGKIEDLGGGKKKDRHGCGDFDIAEVLYHLKKGEYVCVSVKSSVWYKFEEPRWVEIDSGTTLRKSISTELRNIYTNKATKFMEERSRLNESDDADRIKVLTAYIDKLLEISQRLANTNDKKNIMTEAKELFYDGSFLQKIDNNAYLLCFNNGVVDFKQKTFRRGVPEDYLSKCTNIDFIPIDRARDAATIHEIETFMHQLFPIDQLYNYMWEHLASTLIGTAGNQTFNMYIGNGQNGKSVLVSLMEMVLGEYKGDVPLSLLTDRRTKIGGLAPELVSLKGVRYAVMQEPQKGDRINEGVMKQLTSGVDPIQCRAPYMTNILTYIPQFKLAVCSNEFMEIKSQDHGTWRRIRVVDFMSLFTENPVENDPAKPYQYKLDLELKDTKFHAWKQVFAALLVEKAYQTNGKVTDCEIVKASSQSYRERQDFIAEFIADKIAEDPNGTITKVELSSEFTLWYQATYGRGGPSQKDVQAYMDKKFNKCNKRKVWTGVRIRYERDEVGSVEDSDIDDVDTSDL
jgi:P4 family phage/plasmid primase-like protien